MAEKRKAEDSVDDTAEKKAAPEAGMVEVPIKEALEQATKALQAVGWDKANAALQAEIMVYAETHGNNQGLVKLLNPSIMAPAAGAAAPEVERDAASSAVVNGHQCPGMLALVKACDLACDKAKAAGGIAIVGVHNTSTSSGQLAFYGARIAAKGMIGIILANSPEFVAPKAGAKPVFGTNPMCFAVPTDGAPVVLDMATAAVALFGVLTAKAKGEPLPEGSAYDESGAFTTDANAVPPTGPGAIAAFGGHKGAALALMVELLAGALPGAAVLGQCSSKKEAKSWGHTVLAWSPGLLTDGFEAKASSICEAVKASGDGVRLPGENCAKIGAERTAAGVLPVAEKVWASISETAATLKEE